MTSALFSDAKDFVTPHASKWRLWLSHLVDQPNITGLEIGLFEGRSAAWWLENILTHQTSRLLCCDKTDDLFCANRSVFQTEFGDRFRLWLKPQTAFVHDLPVTAQFDFAYVDGSKDALTILETSIALWQHVKPGGIVIWDDYRWNIGPDRPRDGIDTFLRLNAGQCEIIESGWQMTVKRTV